ncbi:isoleucine--tRNA ligase [Egicoccus sp. AB-alg2]|uniref:isoleucine--tRNA ligase n=1 Tax=Egicoccus sp. AB-alg2 TaxID=3242693 RepID=UPI00359DC906
MTTWPTVAPQPDLPRLEEEVLERWRELDVFARSLRQRADQPVWTFYEGPPTANGRPGTHHVEARTFKDIFPRYRTMKGHFVRRKGGWDCHGLPVELEVEKELGLNSKADIEAYGIEKFNARCRESVLRYVDVWERLTERIGFWIDTDDPYRTMDATYVDSLWWGLKELWDRDLIFEDYRVAPYCGRCGTALSDAEVAQGYETVEDPSVYVRFPLLDGPLAQEGAALVVWTTTPWTLVSNTACAVGADVRYQLVRQGGDLLVLAADLADAVLGEGAYEVVRDVAVDELVGSHYEAPFTVVTPGATETGDPAGGGQRGSAATETGDPAGGGQRGSAATETGDPAGGGQRGSAATETGDPPQDWRYVVTADFVTTTDGSGIVHLAPAFGADDMEVGRANGLPVLNPVDREGKFTVGPWAGTFVKDADPAIIEDLQASGRLLRADRYTHTYPHCWRCKRPLIYYAKPSWYIRTTAVRDRLLENNAGIDWHPEHIRDGRFGNWLENNVDWALSRDRYWGTPLPFWRCASGHVTVVGSRAELSELTGQDHSALDPHRPYVDEVKLDCATCGATATRVPDVADAWFDSGAMPYAQWGYPHQGHEEFGRHFPADYICEAIDQTRGWFYTLLAESTLLFDGRSYETVLCLGHIVDEDGRKMSKSAGNILDPWELIGRHGADPLRWLMLAEGNPWVSRRVGHQLLEEIVRRFLLTIWNTHVFFTTYAAIDGFALSAPAPAVADRPASDRWVLAELADVVTVVDAAMDRYDVSTATRRLERFVDDLSNWYVRRNRRRFWKAASDDPADKAAAYHTLHTCLTTLAQLMAPFTPFFAERLWQDLVVSQDTDAQPSVHLTDFPVADPAWVDDELRAAMGTARRVVELGRQARTTSAVKVRQPLARALVTVPESERAGLVGLVADIADELNVKQVELTDGTGDLVERSLRPNFRALGPAFGKRSPAVGNALRDADPDTAAEVAAALATDGAARLTVDGDEVSLTPEMVEVVETSRTGWAVASQGSTSFALDTALTRELEVEGVARELVRAVNDLRKSAGLALDDRIVLSVVVEPAALDGELADAGLYDLVAREVLATDVVRGEVVDDATEVELGLGMASVAIERVA